MVKQINGAAPQATKKTVNGAASGAKDKVHAADSSAFERARARFEDAQAEFMGFFKTPTWKRTLVACLSGLAVAAGCGWLLGNVIGYLMVGAIIATNSMFVALALAVVASIWGALKAGRIAARVTGAILTGEADERVIDAYDATRALLGKLNPFSWGDKPVAATVH